MKTETRSADRVLDQTGKNLRQAQQRLATLLAAARLAAAVRDAVASLRRAGYQPIVVR